MSSPTCINLLARFGDRYRVGFDPAYDPRNRPRTKLDPWMMVIPCSRGEVYPQGDDLLAVHVEGRCRTRAALAALGLQLHTDGDREATFLFSVDQFDAVAEIVKPRRRRRLSPEQRTAAAERLRQYRFDSRTSDHETERQTADLVPA